MVYRLTPQRDLTILATYPDGRKEYAPGNFHGTLLQASNGKLYGTVGLGGKQRAGAIFELSLDGTYKVLHEFTDFVNGIPTFLTEATDGNLYGVTEGQIQLGGYNTLYRISPSGNYERLQVLNGATIGNCPCWLTQGSDSRFYGTAMNGGPGFGSAWIWDLGLPKPLPNVHKLIPASGSPGTEVVVWGENLLGAPARAHPPPHHRPPPLIGRHLPAMRRAAETAIELCGGLATAGGWPFPGSGTAHARGRLPLRRHPLRAALPDLRFPARLAPHPARRHGCENRTDRGSPIRRLVPLWPSCRGNHIVRGDDGCYAR